MENTAAIRAGPEPLARWRQQIARQRHRREADGPRGLAAIGYLPNGPIYDGLIDVRRLVFVVLYDERRNGRLVTRVAGYTTAGIPWGIKIGGPQCNRFEKDLLLTPSHTARGRRFKRDQPDLLTIALQLDRYLDRHERHHHIRRWHSPRWPQMWAAFEPVIGGRLRGAGPEFEAWSAGHRKTDLRSTQRDVLGMPAFPLEFVSHAWQQFTMVLADLRTIPKRQVIGLRSPSRSLCGFNGAIEHDLSHSRFSSVADRA